MSFAPPSPTQYEAPAHSDFDDILASPTASTSAGPGGAPVGAEFAAPLPAGPLTTSGDAYTVATGLEEFAKNWTLYRDPVLAGAYAGVVLGVAGVFVVLRRAVFVTAAVSQAAGLGIACGFLLAIYTGVALPPVVVALLFAGLGALSLAVRPPARLPREATVGIVYLVSSALAVIVGDRISQEAHDIASILFGSAVLVRATDLWSVVIVGTIVLIALVGSARGLAFAGFDPDAARVQALPVRTLDAIFWLLVAAEIAVTTRALGALPVFAFAVLPALAALRVSRRLPPALLLAAIFGAVSGSAGYLAAFLFELPVGASQATLAALIALVCLGVGTWRR